MNRNIFPETLTNQLSSSFSPAIRSTLRSNFQSVQLFTGFNSTTNPSFSSPTLLNMSGFLVQLSYPITASNFTFLPDASSNSTFNSARKMSAVMLHKDLVSQVQNGINDSFISTLNFTLLQDSIISNAQLLVLNLESVLVCFNF